MNKGDWNSPILFSLFGHVLYFPLSLPCVPSLPAYLLTYLPSPTHLFSLPMPTYCRSLSPLHQSSSVLRLFVMDEGACARM